MVARATRRTILCFVCASFLFGTGSVNAGFWSSVSNSAHWLGNRVSQSRVGGALASGTRWLSGQAVEFGTYWALNTNIADRFGACARMLAPGTYSRWYIQKLGALQDVLNRNRDKLGIISPVASLLLAGYGGLPLTIAQQIGAIFISNTLSRVLYGRKNQASNQINRVQPVAEVAPASQEAVDGEESLSEVLWLLAKQILVFTGNAVVMNGAQVFGNRVCPLLGSNEWQHVIDYAALRLYGAAVSRL